jgi:hypothetical protein
MLTQEGITERRSSQLSPGAERVTFSVTKLYGLSTESVALPLGAGDSIESGQVCVTADPEADAQGNIGIIDYPGDRLKVTYAVQAVFPGLYELVRSGEYDPTLLAPVRMVATDDCTLTSDLSGWHAFGCLDFLPGSYWSGAKGG